MARTDVVTLYFCGSGNHRGKGFKFTIPAFFNNTKGDESRKIIFDGPGGADIQNAEKVLKLVESGKSVSSKKWNKTLSSQQKGGTMGGITGKGRLKDAAFKCVVPTYEGAHPNRSDRELIPKPGRHSSAARFDQHCGEGKIGAHLCQTFLEAHGTEIGEPYGSLSKHQLIECYAETHGDWASKSQSKHRK